MDAPVSEDSSVLYFSKNCFGPPVNDNGILTFGTVLTSNQPSDESGIVTSIVRTFSEFYTNTLQPRFSEYEIQCKYEIDGQPISLTQAVVSAEEQIE